jgi:hypothetical protein
VEGWGGGERVWMDSEQVAGMALAHTRHLETTPRGARDGEDPGVKPEEALGLE